MEKSEKWISFIFFYRQRFATIFGANYICLMLMEENLRSRFLLLMLFDVFCLKMQAKFFYKNLSFKIVKDIRKKFQ